MNDNECKMICWGSYGIVTTDMEFVMEEEKALSIMA